MWEDTIVCTECRAQIKGANSQIKSSREEGRQEGVFVTACAMTIIFLILFLVFFSMISESYEGRKMVKYLKEQVEICNSTLHNSTWPLS